MQKTTKRARVSTKKTTQSFNDNDIRVQAEKVYHRTGNPNADENWFQAKKELGLT